MNNLLLNRDVTCQRLVGIGGVKPDALTLVNDQLTARDEVIAGYERELVTAEVMLDEQKHENAKLKQFYDGRLNQAEARIELLEETNGHLGQRIQELETDLSIMVQTARVADQSNKDYEAYTEQLEMKVRELAALLAVMAARHIPGRDPDNLQCNQASVKAMQLIGGSNG